MQNTTPHDSPSPDVQRQMLALLQAQEARAAAADAERLAKHDAVTLFGLFGDSLTAKYERDSAGVLRQVLDLPEGVKADADPHLLCLRYQELSHAARTREALAEREREREACAVESAPAKMPRKPAEPRHKDEKGKRCPTWFRQNPVVQGFVSRVDAGAKAKGKTFAIGCDCSLSDVLEALERLDVFKDNPTVQKTKREAVSAWCKDKGIKWESRSHAHDETRVETLLEMYDAGESGSN